MIKLEEAAITFLVNSEGATIEIKDKKASVTFCEIKLTPEQLCSALSRLACTPCEATVYGIDKVGKVHTHKSFRFEIPSELASSSRSADLTDLCMKALKAEGMSDWIPDSYFGSQGSFAKAGDQCYANAVIRKWE